MLFKRLFVTVAFGAIFVAPPASAMRSLKPGQIVDKFSVATLRGSRQTIIVANGRKPTVILFWAAWSSRSSEILLDYEDVYSRLGKDRINIVAVNVETENPDLMEIDRALKLTRDRGVTFNVAFDADLSLYDQWGVGAVPSAVLLDPGGVVLAVLDGYPSTEMREEFQTLVMNAVAPRNGAKAEGNFEQEVFTSLKRFKKKVD